MTKQADLIAYIFDAQAPGPSRRLSGELLGWLEASPRFTTFVETYRDKIRKKVRVVREPGAALDLRSELEVACCLLSDRRLDVAYEPYASARVRGPDFSVTYRANLVFNIEVTRLRTEENGSASPAERILRILLAKLGQMQPGMPNLLAIHTSAELAQSVDLAGLMQVLKARVEGKDPAFYTASRYAGPADFYRDFQRLSGILLWAGAGQAWSNKQARPALDEKVIRLVAELPGK